MSIFRHKSQQVTGDLIADAPTAPKEFREGYVHVHGSEQKADELAMRAYGDSDKDGKPDVPFMPFPG